MGRLEDDQQPYCGLSSVAECAERNWRALLDLRNICVSADLAVGRLRVRFINHPHFWTDMIRSARSGNEELRMLTRMTVIPFVFAEECSQAR